MNERVRAIIIDRGKLILIRRKKPNETYWVLPGGGVETNETHEQALRRELMEELGADCQINELVMELPIYKSETQGQIEFFYKATIIGGRIGTGQGPEFQDTGAYKGEHIVEEVGIDNLHSLDLKPVEAKNMIIKELI
jgi:ADP-ribose pyrophosphatase YjhB (NUDIX family)